MKYLLALITFLFPVISFSAESSGGFKSKNEVDDKWIFSATWENDYFANSDDNYTNGMRISWLSPETNTPNWLEDLANSTPFFDIKGAKRLSYSIGQDMYTPGDIFATNLITNDRPYAGWLYASTGLVSNTENELERLELTLGMVGPSSKAYEVQKAIHDAKDIEVPHGWDNQLRDEPGAILAYEKAWKKYMDFGFWGLGFDVTPKAGLAVGNIQTYGSTGFTLRIGRDLPSDFGPPKIRPRLPGSEYFIVKRKVGYYLFADVEGRAVARNIFLDGNTFRESHHVDKEPFVGDLQFGVAFTYKDYRLAYTHIYRTREFEGQNGDFEPFGAVTFSVRY